MRKQISAALVLLLAGLAAGAVQAQHTQNVRDTALSVGDATSNVPVRAGEASTMTNGVPNLLASNVQPGEMGIQGRLTMRPATAYGGDPGLRMMGAPGLMRPVLIAPPVAN